MADLVDSPKIPKIIKGQYILTFILLMHVIFLYACFSIHNIAPIPSFEIGGGGSVHHQPECVFRGQPVELTLELTAWGEGIGKMSERNRDVKCHYKNNTWQAYKIIPMFPVYEDKNKIAYSCQIPSDATKDGNALQYYFDYVFDGHDNKREEKPVPIK